MRGRPTLRALYRVGIALIGSVVLVAGIVLIPYPGPGWLVVFAGLAILASEFVWAARVLGYLRRRYRAWTRWLGRQPWWIRSGVFAATGLAVLLTLWLLGVWSLVAGWLGMSWAWLRSPLS